MPSPLLEPPVDTDPADLIAKEVAEQVHREVIQFRSKTGASREDGRSFALIRLLDLLDASDY